MASTKTKQALIESVPAPTPAEPTTNGHRTAPALLPGAMTEDGYYVPAGITRRVDCLLFPGLNLVFLYLPSVAYAFTREDYQVEGVDNPLENECRKMAMYLRGVEGWKFKSVTGQIIPPPDPTDWTTYIPICALRGELGELYGWIVGEGLRAALRAANPN
jgi:hypothetical protein